ncbi:MAG: ribonuclease P protein component [Prevotellaceae bacterium]|jgi:ribonuclease P protein component|nr:ribonuclease P protein component [Prevotellaceae bacterium]
MYDKTFRKKEKLCSKKLIAELFESGKEFRQSPFKLVYSLHPFSDAKVKVLISVPKRNHKRAVKRNFLKRRIREAYRLNKNLIYSACTDDRLTVNLIIIYVSHRISEYQEIERKLVEALESLAKRVEKDLDIPSGYLDSNIP